MKRFFANEHGSSSILIGFTMVGLLVITGLVIDGGVMYAQKTHLQKVANAAALSGAQELTNEETEVATVVRQVLIAHEEQGSLDKLTTEIGRKVTVDLRKEVNLSFSKLFGFQTATVEARAAAQIIPISRAQGAAPLGLDDSVELEYGNVYRLKLDETEAENGRFGILALGGPGADTYETNLIKGYSKELKVGDIIDTEAGNIVGKTQNGVKDRLNRCTYPPGEMFHRDCPRVILIPLYTKYGDKKQLKQVEITGFAYFYITEPVSDKDKTINGIFIKRAGNAIADPGQADTGAYAIRLVE